MRKKITAVILDFDDVAVDMVCMEVEEPILNWKVREELVKKGFKLVGGQGVSGYIEGWVDGVVFPGHGGELGFGIRNA